MASEKGVREAHVWVWLPGRTEPVAAGHVHLLGECLVFRYAPDYLSRADAVPIYLPELPLQKREIAPPPDLRMAGCLRDGLPDAWGRRVIEHRLATDDGRRGKYSGEILYMLESGSDRIGALDFQRSGTEHIPRPAQGMALEDLQAGAERIEAGARLPPELAGTFWHGSAIGGARPKALLEDGDRKLIAKFSSSGDRGQVMEMEFVAMRLAARIGLSAAAVELRKIGGKSILLVERFDRIREACGWRRRMMVSALTLFGLDSMALPGHSYAALAEIVRHRFTDPKDTLRELFGRLVFNVICGNTDDHARNHAAFWDGARLALTPAYDICPQYRTGNVARQAMAIAGEDRRSTLATCRKAAAQFLLDDTEADVIIAHQLDCVRMLWDEVCDAAELGRDARADLWGKIFLNPYIFEGKNAP